MAEEQESVVENFGRNLTELAKEGELDPIIGREQEIERVSQVLVRRKKNNPVLIGQPGVGKTAIVEGLAKKIVDRETSRSLFDKEILELSLTSLVAGTRYRGQFEDRMNAVIEELEGDDDKILFIDELHTIMGTGQAKGGLDASNMLKPALADGRLQCIGATTLEEYRNIENNGALERRFQKIVVDPSSEEETKNILRNIRKYYEEFHNVKYSNDIIDRAVTLAGRYITDRFFPDKAVDIIDEVGSRVNIQNIDPPEKIIEMEEKLNDLEEEKQEAVSVQNFEKAAELRDKQDKIEDLLEEEKIKWFENREDEYYHVERDDLVSVVSMITDIPEEKISADTKDRVLGLEDRMKEKIIGQDRAIDTVTSAMKRATSGIKDPDRPIGTFLFLGPTGVGKTETAKVLTEEIFESRDNLIRVDMSEYQEKFESTKLMGSPPGYVGHEEGGDLTEKVRRNPYSVVLLDEIEKAHPEIFNTLLQVMDDGVMTDGMGREIDFTNVVLIMTSNVGSEDIVSSGSDIGFSTNGSRDPLSYESIKEQVEDKLGDVFKPEFLNRLDDVVVFNALEKEDVREIIDIELDYLRDRLELQDITLNVTSGAKDVLIEKGYSVEYGARPLKRTLRKEIEEPMSDLIIGNDLEEGDEVRVRKVRNEEEVELDVNP